MRLLLSYLSFAFVLLDSSGATLSGHFLNEFDPSKSTRIERVHAAAAVFNYEKSYHSAKVSVPECSLTSEEMIPFAEKKLIPDRNLTIHVEYYGRLKQSNDDRKKNLNFYQIQQIIVTLKKINEIWVAKICDGNSSDIEGAVAIKEYTTDFSPCSFFVHLQNEGDDLKVNVSLNYPEQTKFYKKEDEKEADNKVLSFNGDLIIFN